MSNEPITLGFFQVVKIMMFLYLSCRFIFHTSISCYDVLYVTTGATKLAKLAKPKETHDENIIIVSITYSCHE